MKGYAWAIRAVYVILATVLAYALLVWGSHIAEWLQNRLGFRPPTITSVFVLLLLGMVVLGFLMYKKLPENGIKNALLGIYWPLILITAALAIFEAQLYSIGHRPGMMREYSYMQYRDSFALTHRFVADSLGITIANKSYFDEHEPQIPINQAGFRSREFTDTCPGKPRILLLGDSFLWGLAADPITEGFADILGKNHCTYNTGIIGADPGQYLAVAQTYIPKLKPHLTCLFVYTGNDITPYEPRLRPFVPNYFWAEGMGVSSVFDKGCGEVVYFDNAETAYHFYLSHFSLHTRQSWLLRTFAKTNLATQLYFYFNKPNFANCIDYTPDTYTRKYINSIQAVAERHGSQLLLFVIPDKNELPGSLEELYAIYPRQFNGLNLHLPLHLTPDDYALGADGHFNNQGHIKYAAYVQGVLDSLGY